jgi:DNA-directed RNA polymerase specialized sigma24 family protein
VSRAFSQLDGATEATVLAGVRRGGAGRAAAFDQLFRALREPVLALCLHVAGRRSDAEDALQETFFALEGLGHAAIAEILGFPEGTVWSRLHLARARLRERLGRPESG